jgi:glutathione S-transferase
MLELYNAPQSTCSQKVRLTLAEKGLEFVEHKLKLFQNDQLKPEYLKLNPNGVVPTLVDDRVPIIDSSVIMEYLDEQYPEISLTPADTKERAKMRAWLRFFEEVPTVAVRFPSYNAAFARHFSKMTDDEFQTLAKSKPLRDKFLGEMDKTQGFSADKLKTAEDSIRKTVTRMEPVLSANDYLLGPKLTLADFCVLPAMIRMEEAPPHTPLSLRIQDYRIGLGSPLARRRRAAQLPPRSGSRIPWSPDLQQLALQLLALRDRARARQPCGSLLPDEPCHIPRELGSDSDRRGARNSAAFASTVCRIPPRARFLSTLGNFYGPLSTITGHGSAASRE